MKIELTYQELIAVYAPVRDALTLVKSLQRASGQPNEVLDHLNDKLTRALEILRLPINDFEFDNPEHFGL
jgi:hypothetical protein